MLEKSHDDEPQEAQTEKHDEAGIIRDDSIDYEWELGDVDEDLKALEQAIIRDNAEEYLKQAERLEELDTYAAQRRPLLPDIHLFLSGTVVWSVIFVVMKKLLRRKSSNFAQLLGRRLLTIPWDIHFWVMVVAAPMLFLQRKRASLPEPEPIPDDLRGLGPQYLKFISPDIWENPETSCRDYVLCLAEQWVSAVKYAAGFGGFMVVCAAILRMPNRLAAVPKFSPFAVALVQFVTRLGATVSLFQFPKHLFQLQRSQQPRPLRAEVARLQGMVKSLFRWSMPVGLASDLSQLLVVLRGRSLGVFCGLFVAFLGAMEICFNQSRKPWPPDGPWKKRLEKVTRHSDKALEFLVATGVPCSLMVAASGWVIWNLWKPKNLALVLPMIPWVDVIAFFALLLALIRPIWHIIAFTRIVEIVYMHDMSLTTGAEVMKQTMNNPQEREKRYIWRSRLRWREPERVKVVFDRAWGNYWRWFFFSGSVQDKTMQEETAEKEEKAREERLNSFEYKSRWILERVKRDVAAMPPGAPKPDRRLWKRQAMELVAIQLQDAYEKKDIEFDSLGIALHQRLGIGLRFPHDHTKKLKAGETPSTKRLQMRAVKSAIERVNNLYKATIAESKRVAKELKDPSKKEEKLREIDEKFQAEIDYYAKRLSELIPTTPSGEYGPGMKFLGETKTIMAGGRPIEIAVGKETDRSVGADSLMKWYDVTKLDKNETATNDDTTQDGDSQSMDELYDYTKDSDEFTTSYLKQRFGGDAITETSSEESEKAVDDFKNKNDSDEDDDGSGEIPVIYV